MYSIPNQYYLRLHHCRPRFKGDIENVLIYIATEISKIPDAPDDVFAEKVNDAIKLFPGNYHRTPKTINNWRTEISSLFGFIESAGGYSRASRRAKELAENEDLVASFKEFLFSFQYPGGHIKSHEIKVLIDHGIHFKPAQTILRVLQFANDESAAKGKGRVGLTKAEVCHCIFDDMRCTRDQEAASATWERIRKNRENDMDYDQTGDVIRYAGDIVDYMEIANLLITYDSKTYYLNPLESEAILKFVNSNEWFSDYDRMIEKRVSDLASINACKESWFTYVNRDMSASDFSTDILAFLSEDAEEYEALKKASIDLFDKRLQDEAGVSTKDIGDIGESLVHSHECERVKLGGRNDLVHLIKRIPTQLAVGYDISSVELDARKRYIEVKTTISSKPLHFYKLHLTSNEWNTAESVKDRYFIYRLLLSKEDRKLFLIQDPVGLYKKDAISMVPNDGADITFNPATAGIFEELLSWQN